MRGFYEEKKFSHREHRRHRDFILRREKERKEKKILDKEKKRKRKSLATENTEGTEILFYEEKKR